MFNKLKRNSKQQYYYNIFNDYTNDMRKTWKTINTIIRKQHDKSNVCDTYCIDNAYTDNPDIICNGFCRYLTDVGERFATSIPKSKHNYKHYLDNNACTKSLFMSPTDPIEIKQILSSLKPKTSCGHDGINTTFLKIMSTSLCNPITLLINKSIENGHVPNTLKIAKVVPIYKSKDQKQLSNYRPISLLSSISKILEKVIHKRVYNFLNHQNMFYQSQYGFRPKHNKCSYGIYFRYPQIN